MLPDKLTAKESFSAAFLQWRRGILLKRLAAGVAEAGHPVSLFTSAEWPAEEWNFGPVVRLNATQDAIGFADELEKVSRANCDVC
jgi:hypothetical protein